MTVDLKEARLSGTPEDSIFIREDGSWGWLDETWNDGDSIHYLDRNAAAKAQSDYTRDVLVGKEELVYHIMYDCTLRKVGCVLLQALGGTVPNELFFKHFGDPACWILSPTPGLKCYPVTESQLELVAANTDFTEKP